MKIVSNLLMILCLEMLCTNAEAQNLPANNSSTLNTTPVVHSKPFNSQGNSAPTNYNLIRTWIPFLPIVNAADVTSPTINVKHNTSYINGFGQTLQTIACMSDFNHDMVTVYDQRTSNEKVSYLPYPVQKNNTFQMSPFGDEIAYFNGVYPEEQGFSFSLQKQTAQNGVQDQTTYMPGAYLTGLRQGKTVSVELNTSSDDVKIWNTDQGIYFAGFYGDNVLTKKITNGLHNALSIEYYNKDNQIVLKKVQINNNDWLKTYYIYDDLGRLVLIMPPKATAQVENNGNFLTSDIRIGLCYSYQYDDYGQIIMKHTPDQNGNQYVVMDSKHRPILIQTPNMVPSSSWKFIIYDHSGRTVSTGIFKTNDDPKTIQSLINSGQSNPNTIYSYLINEFDGDYTALVNNNIPDCNVYEIDYYDSYDQDPSLINRPFIAYTDFLTGPQYLNPQAYPNPFGLLTGKRIQIIDGAGAVFNKWTSSLFYYDEHGKLIQTQTIDPFNDNHKVDINTTQYQFDGKIALAIEEHFAWNTAQKPSTKIVKKYEYDIADAGRLMSVKMKMDSDPAWRTLAFYNYNDRGQIKKKMLGQIEYQYLNYNIRNQLTDLNKDYIDNPSCTDCSNMTFAEQLAYERGFSEDRYDGNIAGFIWRGAGMYSPKRAYGYDYDYAGRMISADFRQWEYNSNNVNGYDWGNSYSDYSVSNINYDENGNLLSMKQRGVEYGTVQDIDDLNYFYQSSSNKLDHVADGVTTHFADLDDYTDNQVGTGAYQYDNNGNLQHDYNKDLDIGYNLQDLPTDIKKSQGDYVRNIYAGDGTLIQKTIVEGNQTNIYRYWGNLIYRNDSLLYVLNDEGRCRWLADSNLFKYDYFIKDHLGNVRTTIEADYGGTLDYLATHELASAHLEQAIFDGMGIARTTKPSSSDPNDQEAAGLDGSDPTKQIGTSILIKVMAGDKFNVSADSYYDNTGNSNVGPDPGAVLSAITSTLIGGQGGLNPGEAGQNADIVNHLFSSDNYLNIYEGLKESMTNPEYPRAYLNYIVFDEDMRIIPEQSGAIQVGATANVWTALELPTDITIGKNGFLGVYISDEQNKKVWFDNVQLTYFKSRLLEEQHYYPHGLVIKSGANTPLPNKFKYQGKELQDELGIQWYDFHARQYDPQIGRFWGIDPADQFPSGYTGMANDPANNIDPTGMNTYGAVSNPNGLTEKPEGGGHGYVNLADFENNAEVQQALAGMQQDLQVDQSSATSQGNDAPQDSPGSGNNAVAADGLGVQDKVSTTTDAGHGNNGDPGAIDGKNYEKDYALMIEKSTDYWLDQFGFDNHRTRTDDVTNSDGFKWRVNTANNSGSEIFISFHLNGGTDSKDVFAVYQQDKSNETNSIALGNSIMSSLGDIMQVPAKSVVPVDGHTRYKNLAVLSGFKGGAGVLIEFGSISNEQNRAFIQSHSSDIGFRVALGIYKYVNNGALPMCVSRGVDSYFNNH